VVASLIRRISFENGDYFGKPILGEMRLYSSVTRRFSDRVLVNRSFKPIVKRTGLPPIAFKDLRHTAASLLFKLGIHPKQVQEMLGHKDIRLTLNTYSHISPDMQDTVVNAMNTALNRSQKQQSTWPASPKP
jgi:integrase